MAVIPPGSAWRNAHGETVTVRNLFIADDDVTVRVSFVKDGQRVSLERSEFTTEYTQVVA